MNKKLIFAVTSLAAMTLIGCSNYTRRPYTEIPLAEGEEEVAPTEFCAFEDFPKDVPFKYVHAVKASKMVYADPKSLRPAIEKTVRKRGGNAVANYHENIRFGAFSLTIVRPVASGDAITILNTRGKTCEEMGGQSFTK
ncbi:MAG: hypothetical protein J6Z31_02660 [Fibrobacter sp.]|nr:hypothetical protein [Fibrobacter sp.]